MGSMDWKDSLAFQSVAYAMAHPLEAAAEVKREEDIHRLAFVLGVPFSVAEPAVETLCSGFDYTPEGLYKALVRGDENVWQRANVLTAIEPQYTVSDMTKGERG